MPLCPCADAYPMKLDKMIELKAGDKFFYRHFGDEHYSPAQVKWTEFLVETFEFRGGEKYKLNVFGMAFRLDDGRQVMIRSNYPFPDFLELPDYAETI
jgi:hypothetical protein